MILRFFCLLALLFFTRNIYAQNEKYDNDFKIKDPGKNYAEHCGNFRKTLKRLPKEVGFRIDLNELNEIYIVCNDIVWFDKLISNKRDALSIDIVTKKQFPCRGKNLVKNGYSNYGQLMKPMYMDDLKAASTQYDGNIIIKFGELPEQFNRRDCELNLVFIQDNYACETRPFRNLERYRWNILNMGLFMDTLTENTISNTSVHLDKVLRFIIPFEKNKYEFEQMDIKPIYDSLNLTDFNITSIKIIAYTSVEGTTENNIRLQNKRAESIIRALQAYQTPIMEQHIDARENWVEFLEDISKTGYKSFINYSKDEIKDKLNSQLLSAELEPVLARHRKAIIEVKLEKKYNFMDKGKAELISLFHQQIERNNIEKAQDIQNVIFQKVQKNEISLNVNEELKVPEQAYFGLLRNNQIAFSYFREESDLFHSIRAFEELLGIIPQSYQVRYNLVALKLKAWISNDIEIDNKELLRQILELQKFGISEQLINRLLINYHIINSEYLMQQRLYRDKDESVETIYEIYSETSDLQSYSQLDLLRLSQYFAYYSHHNLAEKIIGPLVFDLDAEEDLLFYFIQLTLHNYNQYGEDVYRRILLNAINTNRQRFCTIFNSNHEDGILMQFLNYDFLKAQYCDNCR